MLATVTVKGQVTIPKALRDRLKIEPGTQLDFMLADDGSLSVRLLKRSALAIIGILQRPTQTAVTVEQMTQSFAAEAVERHQRSHCKK